VTGSTGLGANGPALFRVPREAVRIVLQSHFASFLIANLVDLASGDVVQLVRTLLSRRHNDASDLKNQQLSTANICSPCHGVRHFPAFLKTCCPFS
jgi:hypothetical protein